MYFNSLDFAVFLPVIFVLYWFITAKHLRLQNLLIVIASYIFYGWWDYRFLSLILFSSLVDFLVGLQLGKQENGRKRKWLLATSIVVNLGLLGFFKYFNFFAESFSEAFTFFGGEIKSTSLNIILPVGISFYTFQTLGYSIDVYRRKVKPTSDPIVFFAFVSFFPQLVAGPIERASNLLPQFYKGRQFVYGSAVDGLRQILWGLFKKAVIADNCAEYADQIFSDPASYSGSALALGAFFFTIQIYSDFSGYSDIAIGVSRLFGFNLKRNFDYPYFSRNVAEFWRKWHISLSTWFRDYLYIPMGGSRTKVVRNILVLFIVSGFWHGANWTFLLWGLLNAICFILFLVIRGNKKHLEPVALGRLFPGIKDFGAILFTFCLTAFTWIFFRAESVSDVLSYIKGIFDPSIFQIPEVLSLKMIAVFFFIATMLITEWLQRSREHGLERVESALSKPIRWGLYMMLIYSIVWFHGKQVGFIYFQF